LGLEYDLLAQGKQHLKGSGGGKVQLAPRGAGNNG